MAPIDLQNVTEVTRALNWRGEHTGYQFANTFVPLDMRNGDAQAIAQKIEKGDCSVLNPKIKSATPTHDRKGQITGYDTEIGFIPADANNALFKILEKALDDGSCTLKPRDFAQAAPKITDLIFCIPFDRPWPHLVGEFWRSWEYKSHDKSGSHHFIVRLLNLPFDPESLFAQILKIMETVQHVGFAEQRLLLAQKGLMTIEVPATQLRSLFKGERAFGFKWRDGFIKDLFQQNLIRNGRTLREGPDIDWLLTYAPQFMSRPIVDTVNAVIDSFRREYGGNVSSHLNENTFERAGGLVFAKRDDESKVLRWIYCQPDHSFQLKGEWSDRTVTPAIAEMNKQLSGDSALLRISSLLDTGFPLEALSVANAYLEIVAQALAWAVTAGDAEAQMVASRGGHRARMKLIQIAALAAPKDHLSEALITFSATAKAIYLHRNDFMHGLRSRDHEHSRTVDLERQAQKLLHPLLDHFEVRIWLGSLAALTRDPSALSNAAKSAAQEAARSMSGKQTL